MCVYVANATSQDGFTMRKNGDGNGGVFLLFWRMIAMGVVRLDDDKKLFVLITY